MTNTPGSLIESARSKGGESASHADHDERRRRALGIIGQVLFAARESRGWSQERVAHAAGISAFTYHTLERGFSSVGELANPTLDTLLRVVEVLEIDPKLLIAADP